MYGFLRKQPGRVMKFVRVAPRTRGLCSVTRAGDDGGQRQRVVADLARGIVAGERAALSRSISLVESKLRSQRVAARELLAAVLPQRSSNSTALRVGISGPPGTGKSTLIETLGGVFLNRGHQLAVLAVDPSSQRSGGSIMGDKTRMQKLAADRRAYIRPSPSQGTLGGVARRTEDAVLLCESAGYDRVIVETVGVGQSEVLGAIRGPLTSCCPVAPCHRSQYLLQHLTACLAARLSSRLSSRRLITASSPPHHHLIAASSSPHRRFITAPAGRWPWRD